MARGEPVFVGKILKNRPQNMAQSSLFLTSCGSTSNKNDENAPNPTFHIGPIFEPPLTRLFHSAARSRQACLEMPKSAIFSARGAPKRREFEGRVFARQTEIVRANAGGQWRTATRKYLSDPGAIFAKINLFVECVAQPGQFDIRLASAVETLMRCEAESAANQQLHAAMA